MNKKLIIVILLASLGLNGYLFVKHFKEDIKKVVYGNKEQKNESTDPPVAFFCLRDTVKSLDIHYDTTQAKKYDGSLIVAPGVYNVNGVALDMSKEGLYRLLFPNKENYQIISYDNDVIALLSAYSWIVTHGNADNKLTKDNLTQKALSGKLSLTCGYVSGYLHKILDSIGVQSRIVSGLTLQPWNSYDNAHVLLEVYHPAKQKWIVADVDGNSLFMDSSKSEYYNIMEVNANLHSRKYEIVPLSLDNSSDVSGFSNKDYSYTLLAECNGSASLRSHWYSRVLDVIFIDNHYYDTRDTARINGYNSAYTYMDSTAFIEKFYKQ